MKLVVAAKPGINLNDIENQILKIESQAPHIDSIRSQINILEDMAIRVYGKPDDIDHNLLHRSMFDMPMNGVEATVQLGVRRAVNARLMSGWYKDKLVFLINSEKSSSTLHEIVIRDILLHSMGQQANFGIQRGLRYGPTEVASGASMHGLIPMYVPDGGVLRGPFLAIPGNKRYLRRQGCKSVLLCRHPADRLVARACMTTDDNAVRKFHAELENGKAFDRFINGTGHTSLRYDLEWMAGWLVEVMDNSQFHVVRYEEMVEDGKTHFDGIHNFITSMPMSQKMWNVIEEKMGRTKAGGDLQPGTTSARSYPKGYSGKVGVWRDYFTDRDVGKYNDVVKSFLGYHPDAERLLQLYPDLLLENK